MNYTVRKTKRTRRLTVTVKYTGEVIVTIPSFVSLHSADMFVQEKKDWIERMQKKMQEKLSGKTILKQTKQDFNQNKAKALAFVKERIAFFNTHYNFSFKDVRVKNQTSRWGSCSSKKNLNFNYGIIYLPPALADYIIVHELCHLKEFNHAKKFWDLVAETIPDFKSKRALLKRNYVQIS